MDELRNHAAWLAAHEPENQPAMVIRTILSELHWHQMELEEENRRLLESREAAESLVERYRSLYEQVAARLHAPPQESSCSGTSR